MYIIPAIILSHFFGSLILVISRHRYGVENLVMMFSATGFIFKQGMFSFVNVLLYTLGASTL